MWLAFGIASFILAALLALAVHWRQHAHEHHVQAIRKDGSSHEHIPLRVP